MRLEETPRANVPKSVEDDEMASQDLAPGGPAAEGHRIIHGVVGRANVGSVGFNCQLFLVVVGIVVVVIGLQKTG
jgi:hypothetical protein